MCAVNSETRFSFMSPHVLDHNSRFWQRSLQHLTYSLSGNKILSRLFYDVTRVYAFTKAFYHLSAFRGFVLEWRSRVRDGAAECLWRFGNKLAEPIESFRGAAVQMRTWWHSCQNTKCFSIQKGHILTINTSTSLLIGWTDELGVNFEVTTSEGLEFMNWNEGFRCWKCSKLT